MPLAAPLGPRWLALPPSLLPLPTRACAPNWRRSCSGAVYVFRNRVAPGSRWRGGGSAQARAGKAAAELRKDRKVCPECGHHRAPKGPTGPRGRSRPEPSRTSETFAKAITYYTRPPPPLLTPPPLPPATTDGQTRGRVFKTFKWHKTFPVSQWPFARLSPLAPPPPPETT